MKPYFLLFRIRFLNNLQYRAAAISGIATQFFWGIMRVFMFAAFYAVGTTQGLPLVSLASYIWLGQMFLHIFTFYDRDQEIFEMIIKGDISYELCRPVKIYWMWFMRALSRKYAAVLLRFLPVAIFACILPQPYGLSLPASPLAFLLFLIALFMASFMVVAFIILVYISIFKTMSPQASVGFAAFFGDFFSGMLVPLMFFPQWLQTVCRFTPFAWTFDFVLRIYIGNIPPSEAVLGIGIQMLWFLILAFVGYRAMNRITRLSTVQGG